jgi:hypothetical protein
MSQLRLLSFSEIPPMHCTSDLLCVAHLPISRVTEIDRFFRKPIGWLFRFSRSSGIRDLFPVPRSVANPTTHRHFYSRNARYINLYREYFSLNARQMSTRHRAHITCVFEVLEPRHSLWRPSHCFWMTIMYIHYRYATYLLLDDIFLL